MAKYVMIFIVSTVLMHAQTMIADYIVEFGIVGQVGKVHTQYTDNKKSYKIDTNLSAVGMLAKTVMNHLKERHICKGIISKKGRRIATSYEMRKSFGKFKTRTHYHVNHQTKKVIKSYKRWEKTKNQKYKKTLEYQYTLGYYATDDMVSLFLNLGKHIKNKNEAKNYQFKAVGADKKNGRVDIKIPTQKESKEMVPLLGNLKNGEWFMNLVMHRQLYNSKKGELMVRMGKDSTIEKAVLKDLLFFGDVRIIRQ